MNAPDEAEEIEFTEDDEAASDAAFDRLAKERPDLFPAQEEDAEPEKG